VEKLYLISMDEVCRKKGNQKESIPSKDINNGSEEVHHINRSFSNYRSFLNFRLSSKFVHLTTNNAYISMFTRVSFGLLDEPFGFLLCYVISLWLFPLSMRNIYRRLDGFSRVFLPTQWTSLYLLYLWTISNTHTHIDLQ